jgi:YbgC/YbaW family acyl-CoA thioester hydrolase
MLISPTPFLIQEYVRWSDVDYAGIIFYGAYVRFFEIAETELFRASGLAYKDAFDRHGIFLPRRVIHAEFFVPARLDDRLTVAAYIGKVGTRSMTIHFDVVWGDPHVLGATGWQVLVCVDKKTLKARTVPEAFLGALAPHTLTPEGARAALGVPAP